MSTIPKLRCRQIAEVDFEPLAAFLNDGFGCWDTDYWLAAFAQMRERQTPPDYPRYGFLMEADGRPVGVILTLFARLTRDGVSKVRCNVSSWYVHPDFRAFGGSMIGQVFKFKDVTLMNVSPARFTWPILEAQGYRRYSQGQTVCLPWLSFGGERSRVRPYRDADAPRLRDAEEAEMMAYHQRQGCMTLVCDTGTELVPLIFLKRAIRRVWPPYVQLFYCRETADFVRFAGPVGRYLLKRGLGFAAVDGEGPIDGIVGKFLKDHAPRYFKGPDKPRLNDLAYTESAVLGV